ncbi:MAG: TonB-dependent receptor [Pseudomonadota bacterium]
MTTTRISRRPSATVIVCALHAAGAAPFALAQAQTATTATNPPTLPAVTVTGNPLGASELTVPVTTLSGEALVLRRGSTLGETLDRLPGVSASYFGPNASRPIIRGQDGDRIRLLSNSGASLDASSLSNDHAVPIDPLVIERIEVLRGPAALLYGGSAVGGVVNTIDNRIPRAALGAPTGAAELRLGGASSQRGAGALVEAGGSGFALHADAFWRRTDDLEVPAFDRPVEGGTERRTTIVNSASRAEGGALGGSLVWDHGYLGASLDTYRNRYGIVAEDDVTIRLQRDKLGLAGEWRDLGGPFKAVRGQVHLTDYQHREIEGSGEIATTFKNRGTDARIELEHQPVLLGGVKLAGVVGLQTENARFSALGEEAFVPGTRTVQTAAFLHEELALGRGKLTFGGRLERTRVGSDGDVDAAVPRFGEAQTREFDTGSVAVGGLLNIDPQWQLTANLASTQRAPTFYELYADGVHVATAAYERGDATMAKERGTHLDLALQWKRGADHVRIGAFASRFGNYIALLRTDEPPVVNDAGEALPVYAFRGVGARFSGVEIDGTWRAWAGPSTLDIDARMDLVRATRRDTGEPLPRIAPRRLTLGTRYTSGPWTGQAEVVNVARQARVPADDTPVGGYTLVNLSGSYRIGLQGGSDALLFVRLDNVGDRLAYNATTIATVRPLAPLAGRSLSAGLRVTF